MSTLPMRESTTHHWQSAQGRRSDQRRLDRDIRPTAERIDGYALALTIRRQRLVHISLIYQEQTVVYPLQVEATLRFLLDLRRLCNAARRYLGGLTPAETQRIRPIGCITKLASLDYLLTEILLNLAQFDQVCQTISPERTYFHLEIRGAFPALLAAYDDTTAMLEALVEKAHQPPKASEPEAHSPGQEEAQL